MNMKNKKNKVRDDNRHFVNKLQSGRNQKHEDDFRKLEDEIIPENKFVKPEPGVEDEGRKEVYVSFKVHSIHDIDIPKQRFQASMTYYVAWEEYLETIDFDAKANENENETEKEKGKEKEKWNTKMFSACFDPQIRLINCFEYVKEDDDWFRVVTVDDGKKRYKYHSINELKEKKNDEPRKRITVIQATRVQCWFEEEFEMADFPLDIQHLHIGVISRWDVKRVAISFDKFQRSVVESESLTSQTYLLHGPRLFSYRGDCEQNSLPLLTRRSDSATGVLYCKAYFAITLSRRSKFVWLHVMLIMTLIGSFSFATYALEPSDLGNRQSVVLTLVLTTVAFKYVILNMLPEIPYLTMIDYIVYGVMVIQAIMLVSVCVSFKSIEGSNQDYVDKCGLIITASCWCGLLLWFLVRGSYLYYAREKYVKLCHGFYTEYYEEMVEEDDEDNAENVDPLRNSRYLSGRSINWQDEHEWPLRNTRRPRLC